MTSMSRTRRDVLKSAAAMSAAASLGNLGTAPAWAAADKAALSQIDQAMSQAVAAKDVPGVVAMAATNAGVLYQGAFGKRDIDKGPDMTADSVFWIASMTKPAWRSRRVMSRTGNVRKTRSKQCSRVSRPWRTT